MLKVKQSPQRQIEMDHFFFITVFVTGISVKWGFSKAHGYTDRFTDSQICRLFVSVREQIILIAEVKSAASRSEMENNYV